MSSEMQGVISSKRMVVLATAVVLTVVMYCAQSCFNMDTGQPVCPQHHTADCCKYETLVSSSA